MKVTVEIISRQAGRLVIEAYPDDLDVARWRRALKRADWTNYKNYQLAAYVPGWVALFRTDKKEDQTTIESLRMRFPWGVIEVTCNDFAGD